MGEFGWNSEDEEVCSVSAVLDVGMLFLEFLVILVSCFFDPGGDLF